MKIVNQFVINITNICNMECPFCLRGDTNNKNLDLSLIPRMFEGIDIIDQLTLTGGEPSCNIKAVKAIVDYLVKSNIAVRGMFIATNGKVFRQELIDAVKTMAFNYLKMTYDDHELISEDDIRSMYYELEELSYKFTIAVSIDKFHEPIPAVNYLKYRLSGVYSDAKETNFSKVRVIARGRGYGIIGSVDKRYYEFSVDVDDNDITAEEVYITVDGKVFADCDMSYEMEEYEEPAGDLHEETLAQIMQRYADEELQRYTDEE